MAQSSPVTIGNTNDACLANARGEGIALAVTVSSAQPMDGAPPDIAVTASAGAVLPPSRLEPAITETVLSDKDAVPRTSLRDPPSAGVRIAIDGFGIGYSSISCFADCLSDKIDIERSLASGPEGVDTDQQPEMLASERRQKAQGYKAPGYKAPGYRAQRSLLGPPMPASVAERLLRRIHAIAGKVVSVNPARPRRAIPFSKIAETVSDIIMVTTPLLDFPDPRILYVNPAFTRLTGYSKAEAVGSSPRMLQGPDTSRATLEAVGLTLRSGLPVHEKILNYTKDGAPYWLDMRIVALRGGDGRITHFAAIERDVTLEKRRFDELEFVADRDALTGIRNRGALLRATEAELEAARSKGGVALGLRAPCLAFIDVDNFKHVNDALGHSAGDAVLFGMADRLAGNVRRSDTIGRLGGEEFGVLMPSVTLHEAKALAERLRTAVADAPFETRSGTVAVTVSIGVAGFTPGDTLTQLMARADAAMYAAKRSGRDRVRTIAELT